MHHARRIRPGGTKGLSMSSRLDSRTLHDRSEVMSALDFIGQLHTALHQVQDWPTPDEIDHERFRAYMKTSHDVGGEPDAPAPFFLKEEEQWELNTYVTCEVLGWRGIWTSEERRRIGNVDLGKTMYLGLPYYSRWLWAIARILMEKQYITLGELVERVHSVGERAVGRSAKDPLE